MRNKDAKFVMADEGIEVIGIYKKAVRAALATGAKTIKGIQKAVEGTMGTFRADYLTLRTAAIEMVTEGNVIMRDGGEFALF